MIIAEIAQAHDGSLGNAHAYIDALAETGIDAVKFQTHIAEAESSNFEPFRVKFSKQDSTRFDYWKRMEFSEGQWRGLKDHCHDNGLKFISSPFSVEAVKLLERIGVDALKIGSGEISNRLMLDQIAKTGKPVIMSSGMSSLEELKMAVSWFDSHQVDLSILQCTTAYPTKPEEWGLNMIQVLKNQFMKPIGFSDHSGDIFACLAAASLGAEIFEFHVVFDKRQFGPDSSASITIDDTKRLCEGIRQIKNSLAHPVDKSHSEDFGELKRIFGKSLAINKDVKSGHIITINDLESKKPGDRGVLAEDYLSILGKRVRRDMKKWEFLNINDLSI